MTQLLFSESPAVPGKWKTKNVRSSSPEVVEFVAIEGNGLSYKVPAIGMAYNAKTRR
jgi:hypothetical protein